MEDGGAARQHHHRLPWIQRRAVAAGGMTVEEDLGWQCWRCDETARHHWPREVTVEARWTAEALGIAPEVAGGRAGGARAIVEEGVGQRGKRQSVRMVARQCYRAIAHSVDASINVPRCVAAHV